MRNIRIIPKLEIKNNNLVKGINLEGLRVIGNPIAFIKEYYLNGADEIIIQDVVASLYGRNCLFETISEISKPDVEEAITTFSSKYLSIFL